MPEGISATLVIVGLCFACLPWLSCESRKARTVVFWVYVCLAGQYLVWRLTASLPVFSLTPRSLAAYAYFVVEIWAVSISYRTLSMYRVRSSRLDAANARTGWYDPASDGKSVPLVDIFVPSYNEGFEIVEKAIVSVMAQDYPRTRVWLLDDGRRAWARDFAERKGIGYLTRTNNAGFKAGNLNHALRHVLALDDKPAFILVVDCDWVTKPNLASRAMCLMRDDDVGIVQTPQVYYNADPLQYALDASHALPDWQRAQFDHHLPSLDAVGGVRCIGTCCLVRTEAIEKIGGFPTETVTEDSLTTVKLNELGYKTIYLNEQLSFGLVCEGLREFLTQSGRWCLGGVQILYTAWGPFGRPKSWMARLLDIEEGVGWGTFALIQVFNLAMSIVFLLTGFTALAMGSARGEEYLLHFLPYWLFQLTAFAWISRGTDLPIIGDARSLLAAPVVIRATLRGLRRSKNVRFDVTDKGALRDRPIVHWRLLRWIVLLACLILLGLVHSTFDSHAQVNMRGYRGISFFWAYYNLVILAIAAAVCIEPPKRRVEERFVAEEPCTVRCSTTVSAARVLDISVGGARLSNPLGFALGDELALQLEQVGALTCTVVRSDSTTMAVRFRASEEERVLLIRKLFTDRYIRTLRQANIAGICWAVVRRALV